MKLRASKNGMIESGGVGQFEYLGLYLGSPAVLDRTPLLYGIIVALILTFFLRETGPAARKT